MGILKTKVKDIKVIISRTREEVAEVATEVTIMVTMRGETITIEVEEVILSTTEEGTTTTEVDTTISTRTKGSMES